MAHLVDEHDAQQRDEEVAQHVGVRGESEAQVPRHAPGDQHFRERELEVAEVARHPRHRGRHRAGEDQRHGPVEIQHAPQPEGQAHPVIVQRVHQPLPGGVSEDQRAAPEGMEPFHAHGHPLEQQPQPREAGEEPREPVVGDQFVGEDQRGHGGHHAGEHHPHQAPVIKEAAGDAAQPRGRGEQREQHQHVERALHQDSGENREQRDLEQPRAERGASQLAQAHRQQVVQRQPGGLQLEGVHQPHRPRRVQQQPPPGRAEQQFGQRRQDERDYEDRPDPGVDGQQVPEVYAAESEIQQDGAYQETSYDGYFRFHDIPRAAPAL